MDFIEIYLSKLPTFEDDIAWMYLDTHETDGKPAPLVTVGKGDALENVADAQALPFTISGTIPPMAATRGTIAMHYNKLLAMKPGMKASFYEYPGCLKLSEDAINALARKRLAAFVTQLTALFPDYATWPTGPQIGALDLIYGMGGGGIHEYTHFIAACKAHDWKAASAECAEDAGDKAYDVRNAWRRQMMLAA